MVETCPNCGTSVDLKLPAVVYQPLLEELGYENPATLASALEPDESVLVVCRAFVGGLAGTNKRLLIIKRGNAYAYDYEEIKEIRLEKVGRFMKSLVCQLVTDSIPYKPMKKKEAKEAPYALEILTDDSEALYERARARLLEVRDARRCQTCGSFVPIARIHELVPGRVDELMRPLGWGEAETAAGALQQGEFICCQLHGKRYAKGLVVTDRRVLVVMGAEVHAFDFAQLQGVEVEPDRLRLLTSNGGETESHGPLAAVRAGNMVPLSEPDRPDFEAVANVIRGRMH